MKRPTFFRFSVWFSFLLFFSFFAITSCETASKAKEGKAEPGEMTREISTRPGSRSELYSKGIPSPSVSGGAYDHTPYPNQPPLDREGYSAEEENRYQLVSANPLSTFSIDVDRASYANVRRFLTQNQLPPPEAVRIEELVNYFDYDYPEPQGEHPFQATLEMSDCPWNPAHQLVHIGIQGKSMDMAEAPASNLVFLLDVSGSMNSPDKLPLLKQAFGLLVEQMRPQDRVGIVVYAGAAGVVLPPTPGSQKGEILAALEKLQSGGSTAGGEGLQLAYQLAQDHLLPEGNNRIILATDGDFNVGESSDGAMKRLIESKRDQGIFLTVLGFGTGNLQDSKMETIADHGNGNYAYIDNVLEAKKTLISEMGGTLFTIAKDVKLQVEFNPAYVQAYRLIGYENRRLQEEDFNDDQKDAGELGAGHTVTALYEVIPVGAEVPGISVDSLRYQQQEISASSQQTDEVLMLKLRYKAPDADQSQLISLPLVNQEQSIDQASENLRFASAVAEYGMLLRKSEFQGEASYAKLISRAKAAKGEDEAGYRAEFIRLAEIAQILSQAEAQEVQAQRD